MSNYILGILLIIFITAAVIIIRNDLLKKHNPEMQFALIFTIPTFPVSLILMKLDRIYQPLENVSWIIKGLLIGVVLLIINSAIYLLIRNRKTK